MGTQNNARRQNKFKQLLNTYLLSKSNTKFDECSMSGFEEKAKALICGLFNESLKDNKIEEAVRKCKLEKSNATKLISLVQLMTEEPCEKLEILYGILHLFIKFLNAKLIHQSFAYMLMVRER